MCVYIDKVITKNTNSINLYWLTCTFVMDYQVKKNQVATNTYNCILDVKQNSTYIF